MEDKYEKVPIDEIEKNTDPTETNPLKYGFGVRHVQAFLFFMCLALGYISRGHLGVTIVGMTMIDHESNVPAVTEATHIFDNGTIINPLMATERLIANKTAISVKGNVSLEEIKTESRWNIYKTYNWSKSVQEMIFGSFFLGYSIMMFPIGLVCQRWGGKIPLQIAMFVNGVVSFFTPWLVTWGGWKALCVLRTMQGLSQAGLYPSILTLLANWVPVSERGSLSSYVYTGSGFGTVIAFQSAGILAFSRFGWPSTFWATGVACLVGFVLITIFGAATPKEHKSISEAERNYIMGGTANTVKTTSNVPWKSVVRSVPVWANFMAHMGNAVCFVYFFIQVPTYMFAVLKLNIRSVTCVVPAICLMSVAYTRDTTLAVTCFVLFAIFHTAMHTGWMINYMDLSPNYSGALLATGNTITNIIVLALPIIVSNIVIDVTNQHQWRITMFLMAGLTLCANIIFIIFLSADVQPWNSSDDTMDKISEYEAESLQPESEEKKEDDN